MRNKGIKIFSLALLLTLPVVFSIIEIFSITVDLSIARRLKRMTFILPFNGTSLDPDLNTDLHSNFPVSLPFWYVLGAFYSISILLSLIGNSMVLYAFPFPGVLEKKKVAYILMMNLAVNDILVLLVQGLPTVGVFFADKWPFGRGLCHVIALIKHTVFFMKLFSVFLLGLHKAYIMTYPFEGLVLTNTSAMRTVVGFGFLSFLLNIIGIIGSDSTTFSPNFMSCNADIYLSDSLRWEGYLLLAVLGVTVSILMTSLFVIGRIARGIRLRRLDREKHFQRPQRSRIQRLKKLMRRNKSIASVVSIAVLYIVTMIPLLLVHLLKWLHAPTDPRFILFGEIFAILNVVWIPAIYAFLMVRFFQFYQERLSCF